MAVTLPSDLVLDVMRNADPVRSREMIARLNQGSDAGSQGQDFAAVMNAAQPVDAVTSELPVEMTGGVSLPLTPGEAADPKTRAYRGFEKMMLQNMVESMLPPADSGVFGDQISGGVWRSMTADALSGAVADSGGIGLASIIAAKEDAAHMARADQWPYFGVSQIQSFVTSPSVKDS